MSQPSARERYLRALAELRGYPYPKRHKHWAARLDTNQPELDALARAPDPAGPPFRPATFATTTCAGMAYAAGRERAAAPLRRFDEALHQARERASLNAFIDWCARPEEVPSSGALAGLLLGVKDNIRVRGMTRTAGSRALPGEVAINDAPCVARLRAAGCLVMGTLNLHELAYGITSDNPHYGAVVNPRAPGRIAGGSSGGSAAAVAAGLVDAALGTDTAGSVRIPAACCGIVGYKPSYGVVPTEGVLPLGWSLDHVGPMARCVADAAAVYDVMVADGDAPPPPEASGLTLVKPANFFFECLDPHVCRCLERVLGELGRCGVRIVERPVALAEYAAGAQFATLCVEAGECHADLLERCPEGLGEDVRVRLEIGAFIPGVDYLRAQRLRREIDRSMQAALDWGEAIITPTLPVTAPAVGVAEVCVDGERLPVHTAATRCTAPFNLTGMPAITLPCGSDDAGAPIGLQLVGRRGEDGRLLRLAARVERLLADAGMGGAG